MLQAISTMVFPVLIGVLMGFAYTRGADLMQSLVKPCRYFVLALLALVCVSLSCGWTNMGASCSIGLGITLVVWCKLYWLRPSLPVQLRGSLAARPGESAPDLYPNEVGGWTLFYPDGTCMRYDGHGALIGVEFNNGWDRSEWNLASDRRTDCSGSARVM